MPRDRIAIGDAVAAHNLAKSEGPPPLAGPYFRSEDKWAGCGLLAAVIAIELAVVANSVLFNQWRNRFYNALQEKDWDGFVREMIVFCVLATILVALQVYQLY